MTPYDGTFEVILSESVPMCLRERDGARDFAPMWESAEMPSDMQANASNPLEIDSVESTQTSVAPGSDALPAATGDSDSSNAELRDLIEQVAARELPTTLQRQGFTSLDSSQDAVSAIRRDWDADTTPRAPSHRLQALKGLSGAATRLADTLDALDVETKLLLGGRVRMNVEGATPPILRPAFENVTACIVLLRLVARRATELVEQRPRRSVARGNRQISAAVVPDVEAHYRAIAERYLGDAEVWRPIAETALAAAEYRAGIGTQLAPGVQASSLEKCFIWTRKILSHLGKFSTAELASLVVWSDGVSSEPSDQRDGAAAVEENRRWLLLLHLLGRIQDAWKLPEAFPGNAAGRIPAHDPARFAIEGLAAIWLTHCDAPFGGRAPKAGSFSRFVEEALTEGPGALPASEVRSASRWFHDHRDAIIDVLRQKTSARRGDSPPHDTNAVAT